MTTKKTKNNNDESETRGGMPMDTTDSAAAFKTQAAIEKKLSFKKILLSRNIGEKVSILKTSADFAQSSFKELVHSKDSAQKLSELRNLCSNDTFVVAILTELFGNGRRKLNAAQKPHFDFTRHQISENFDKPFKALYSGIVDNDVKSCFCMLFTCFMHSTGCLEDPIEADSAKPKYSMFIEHTALTRLIKDGFIEGLFRDKTNALVGGKIYSNSKIEKFVRDQFDALVFEINRLLTVDSCVDKFFKGVLYHILKGNPPELESRSVVSDYMDIMNFFTPDLLSSVPKTAINLDKLMYDQTHDDYLRRTFHVWFKSLVDHNRVLMIDTDKFAKMYSIKVLKSLSGTTRIATMITRAQPTARPPAMCERSELNGKSSYLYTTYHDDQSLKMLNDVITTDVLGIAEDLLHYRQRNASEVEGIELFHTLGRSGYKTNGLPIGREDTDTSDPHVKYLDCKEDWYLAAATSNFVKYYWHRSESGKQILKDPTTKFEFNSSDNEAAIKVAKEYGSSTQFLTSTVMGRLVMLDEQEATIQPPYTMELVDRVNSEFRVRNSLYMNQTISETMGWWVDGKKELNFVQSNMPVARGGLIVAGSMSVNITLNQLLDANPGISTFIGLDTNTQRYLRDMMLLLHIILNYTGANLTFSDSINAKYNWLFAFKIKQGGRFTELDRLTGTTVDPAASLMPLLSDLIANPCINYTLDMIIEKSDVGHNRPRSQEQHKAYLQALIQTTSLLIEATHYSHGVLAKQLFSDLTKSLMSNSTIVDILSKLLMNTKFGGKA
jgi:hypothetical protein